MERPVKINEAAKMLELRPKSVWRTLRQRQIITRKNLPAPEFIQRGLFTVETRQYLKKGTNVKKQYAITLVTSNGLAFINALMAEQTEPGQEEETA